MFISVFAEAAVHAVIQMASLFGVGRDLRTTNGVTFMCACLALLRHFANFNENFSASVAFECKKAWCGLVKIALSLVSPRRQ